MTAKPKVKRLQPNEWTWSHVLPASSWATLRLQLGKRFTSHTKAFADALKYAENTND